MFRSIYVEYHEFYLGENTILISTFWGNSQFGLYYFQFTINLAHAIKLLMKNAYMANR